jgi:hypothetical protein
LEQIDPWLSSGSSEPAGLVRLDSQSNTISNDIAGPPMPCSALNDSISAILSDPSSMDEQDVLGWVVNDIAWPVSDIGLSFDSSHALSVCTYFLQLECARKRICHERCSDRERLSSRKVSSNPPEVCPGSEKEPRKEEQTIQTEGISTTNERELVRRASDSDNLQPQTTDIPPTHASSPQIMYCRVTVAVFNTLQLHQRQQKNCLTYETHLT